MNENRYAILIGSSEFPEEPKLSPLKCPERDVDTLNEILSSQELGCFTETITFKNRPHHEILIKINKILRNASKNDLVLIYYSGHGKLDSAGRLHLATSDTEIEVLESTSIPITSIRNFIDTSPSNKIILIFDCCYSGAAGHEFTKTKGDVEGQFQIVSSSKGIYILTASTSIQVAQEKESDEHSFLSKFIFEGIRDGAADSENKGFVSMDELYRYVYNQMTKQDFQTPMKWGLNVQGDDLILSKTKKILDRSWKKKVKEVLLEFDESIPDFISKTVYEIISIDSKTLTAQQKHYVFLLNQLIDKKLKIGQFIEKWQLNSNSVELPDLATNTSDNKPENNETWNKNEKAPYLFDNTWKKNKGFNYYSIIVNRNITSFFKRVIKGKGTITRVLILLIIFIIFGGGTLLYAILFGFGNGNYGNNYRTNTRAVNTANTAVLVNTASGSTNKGYSTNSSDNTSISFNSTNSLKNNEQLIKELDKRKTRYKLKLIRLIYGDLDKDGDKDEVIQFSWKESPDSNTINSIAVFRNNTGLFEYLTESKMAVGDSTDYRLEKILKGVVIGSIKYCLGGDELATCPKDNIVSKEITNVLNTTDEIPRLDGYYFGSDK